MEPRLFRRLVERRVSITTRDGGWGSGCRSGSEPHHSTSWPEPTHHSILTHLHIYIYIWKKEESYQLQWTPIVSPFGRASGFIITASTSIDNFVYADGRRLGVRLACAVASFVHNSPDSSSAPRHWLHSFSYIQTTKPSYIEPRLFRRLVERRVSI